jgi:Pyruvate/2-oxoacid:ferredoxin oxidoreductase delta subunit
MRDTAVIFCRCKAGIISDEKLSAISEEVRALKAHIVELNDLCAMSIDRTESLREINRKFRKKIVIACYPRAVGNILLQAGAPFEEMTVLNMRNMSVNEIKAEFGSPGGESSYEVINSGLTVPAWFPVVDKKLCSNCGQCSAFCLFGVYSYSERYLKVKNPLHCKNNCPACARACPKTAIIFPRIKEDSVIAGCDPGNSNGQQQTGLLIDRLKQRNNVHRNIFREDLLKKAEEERSRAIEEDKKNKN